MLSLRKAQGCPLCVVKIVALLLFVESVDLAANDLVEEVGGVAMQRPSLSILLHTVRENKRLAYTVVHIRPMQGH